MEVRLDAVRRLRQRSPLAGLEHDRRGQRDDRICAVADGPAGDRCRRAPRAANVVDPATVDLTRVSGSSGAAVTDQVTEQTVETNPFEEFNKAMGAGTVTNPYPDFAAMRGAHITPADVRQLMGLDADADLGFDPADVPPLYTVSSYDAVQEVLRDGERFSSSGYAEAMGPVMGHTILEMDEPEHHAYRSLIQQAFSRKAMEVWEAELVAPDRRRVHRRLRRSRQGRARQRAPLPVPGQRDRRPARAAARRPAASSTVGRSRSSASASTATSRPERVDEPVRLPRRVRPRAARRRRATTCISVLATAEHDGQRLTDDEIIAFCRLLLPAGAETTYRSSAQPACAACSPIPSSSTQVRDDRSLLPQAIEEGLRWEPPLLTIMRTATEDTTVCGVEVNAGAMLIVNMGAANHDESRGPTPTRSTSTASRPRTSRSHPGRTCASACTSPAWRRRW